ncbi:hypothetical protein [Spiroplasma phoeniceum]|nr:hypothetical protein [Spiroplasma phoeniceum]
MEKRKYCEDCQEDGLNIPYDEKNDIWLPDKIWVLKNNTKYDKLEE